MTFRPVIIESPWAGCVPLHDAYLPFPSVAPVLAKSGENDVGYFGGLLLGFEREAQR